MFRADPRIIIENGNNDSPYYSYVLMEDLLEKLKLLNYEQEFIKKLKLKPLNKHYFAMPKNPGEQFFLFASLAAWLIRKIGKQFDDPQEYDDPNGTIASILEVVRSLDIAIDFPQNKLKQGVGEHVVYILDQLANEALKLSSFLWKKPVAPTEVEQELEPIEDDSELILDRIEEEMAAVYSDESDNESFFHLDDLKYNTNAPQFKQTSNQQNTLLSNVDIDAWKLELERVLPQLKVTIKMDGRDWRANLDQMKNHRNGIEDVLISTKSQLEKLQTDISFSLDKIANREKYINGHLEPILEEYGILKNEVAKVNEHYKSISGGVTERTRDLARITDQLDVVKQQMEERGSSMTDGTPLINIKKAVSSIKSEIKEMDIRIGVLQSIVMQAKIRDKKLLEENLESPASTHVTSFTNLLK